MPLLSVHGTSFNLLFLVGAGLLTALACGLGAVPVFFLGGRLRAWQPALRGLAAGLMTTASIEGLLRPALKNGSLLQASLGVAFGVLFLLATRWLMRGRDLQIGKRRGKGLRRSVLVFAVLFIHSFPEGMAMGAAHASDVAGLSLFVLVAIALQNVPEGTAVALPMASSGFGKGAQFWAAVASSIPQPIGAPVAYLLVEHVAPLLPASLAFAGGAMLAVVALELLPGAFTAKHWLKASAGAFVGAAAMVILSVALGVE